MSDPEIRSVLIKARAALLSTRYAFGGLPTNAYARHLEGRFSDVIEEIDRLVPRVEQLEKFEELGHTEQGSDD